MRHLFCIHPAWYVDDMGLVEIVCVSFSQSHISRRHRLLRNVHEEIGFIYMK